MKLYNRGCKKIVIVISMFAGSCLSYGSDSTDCKSVRSDLKVDKVVDLKPEVSPRVVSSPVVGEDFDALEIGDSVIVGRAPAMVIGAAGAPAKSAAIVGSFGRSGGCVPVDRSSPVDRNAAASPYWRQWRW